MNSDLGPNIDVDFGMSNWLSLNPSRREQYNVDKIVVPGLIGQKLLKKNSCAKNWCLISVNFDLWSQNG